MKIKWGNKNESVTFTVTGSHGAEMHDDKLFLSILEKQVCDRAILQQAVRDRVLDVQQMLHGKCKEIIALQERLEDETIVGRVRRYLGI